MEGRRGWRWQEALVVLHDTGVEEDGVGSVRAQADEQEGRRGLSLAEHARFDERRRSPSFAGEGSKAKCVRQKRGGGCAWRDNLATDGSKGMGASRVTNGWNNRRFGSHAVGRVENGGGWQKIYCAVARGGRWRVGEEGRWQRRPVDNEGAPARGRRRGAGSFDGTCAGSTARKWGRADHGCQKAVTARFATGQKQRVRCCCLCARDRTG